MDDAGHVEGIWIADGAAGAMRSVERVRAMAGQGLAGDRYAAGTGSWSKPGRTGGQVTLVEAEAIEAVRGTGIALGDGGTRRNVVTRGVSLNDLVGRRFRVGDVELLGIRPCDPCMHMERLSGAPGASTALEGRGGLRADILTDGHIASGDPVTVLPR